MARNFKELEAKMSRERIARSNARVKKMLAEMPLNELREARELTQDSLADILGINQAAVSKLENRVDMYVSTLRRFVEAMGGQLVVSAHFPDGEVRIKQFRHEQEEEPVTSATR